MTNGQAQDSDASAMTTANRRRGAATVAGGIARSSVRIAIATIGGFIILCAVLTLVARLALPLASVYKGEIEAGLGEYLKRPVTIDDLDLRWRNIGPQLTATGVQVVEDEGRRVAIDEALLDVNLVSSLIRRTLVISELTLVGADLVVERDEDGKTRLHGLSTSTGGQTAQPRNGGGLDAMAWLFNARRVGLLETKFRFIDRAGGTGSETIVLDRVDLRSENVDGDRRLRAEVDLPEEFGAGLELAIDLYAGSNRSLRDAANGRFQITASALNLTHILGRLETGLGGDAASYLASLRSAIDIGDGALSVELLGQLRDNRVASATATLDMTDISRRDGVSLAERASTDLQWTLHTDNNWLLLADGLDVVNGDERLVLDTLRVSKSDAGISVESSGSDGSVKLAANLSTVASSLDTAAWVDDAAPIGRIAGWRAAVTLGVGRPDLDIVMSVPELSFSSSRGAPGLSRIGLTTVVEGSEGRIDIRATASDDVILEWPDLYSNPMSIANFSGELDLLPAANGLRIEGPLQLDSGSLEVSSQLAVEVESGRSPHVDLRGRFALKDVSEVAGFMPDKLLGKGTVRWFSEGLRGGSVSEGELRLFGRASDFPFDDNNGLFEVSMQARDIDLHWLEGWPMAEAMDGTITFNGSGFSAITERGRIDSLQIDRGLIAIDDMRVPRLTIDASGTDAIESMLVFANTGPLQNILEPALSDVVSSGNAGMDLKIQVPLSSRAKRDGGSMSVDGRLYVRELPVAFGRAQLDLESVTGAVGFSLDGVDVRSLKARWLGRPVSLAASMSGIGNDSRLKVQLDGALEGADVLAHYGLPLDRFVGGASRWLATLDIPFDAERQEEEGFLLSASSDLVGSELRLPAPLYKSSSVARPLTVSTRIFPDEPVARWTIEQSGYVDAVVDVADGEMLSLALGLGDSRANTAGVAGIRIDGQVDVLDLDGWIESIAELISDLPTQEGPGSEPSLIPAVSGDLLARRAVLRSMPLGELNLTLNSDDRFLNTVVENHYLRGNARYPRDHVRGATTPLKVRLARVDGRIVDALIGEAKPEDADADEARSDSGGGLDPRELPPIEARIASLGWQKLDLQGVTLKTEPDIAGLEITALGFSHRNLTLIGEGYWRLVDPQGVSPLQSGVHETGLSLTLQSGDFGQGLAGIGLDDLVGAGAGRAQAFVGWSGPAWQLDLEQLDGDVSLELERGRIRQLEPGAGRLIGLFAFQALPQRLGLDFSDVVNDGLAFTTLTGSAAIRGGVVDASLVRLEGPIGVVDVTGQTDLAHQTLDQRITVLPRVSAALPVIGAITGGASAGVGVLIAGGVLKAMGVDLDRIGLREYRLHGSWDDPVLDPWSKR